MILIKNGKQNKNRNIMKKEMQDQNNSIRNENLMDRMNNRLDTTKEEMSRLKTQ